MRQVLCFKSRYRGPDVLLSVSFRVAAKKSGEGNECGVVCCMLLEDRSNASVCSAVWYGEGKVCFVFGHKKGTR